MSDKVLNLEIITPDRKVFEGKVKSVILPGVQGNLGVLPEHTQLISLLDFGIIEYIDEQDEKNYLTLMKGYAEVADNKVKVLSEASEFKNEIDKRRAEAALKRAKEKLERRQDKDIDITRADAALKRAILRLKISA